LKRSKFSLSNYKLLTCDMGELVPAGLIEVLPGDSIQQATSLLVRVSPLLAPVMHPVQVRVHHWFVPTRLLWEDWEDFITGGPDGMDASQPPGAVGGPAIGSLHDYLGIPPDINGAVGYSVLPMRAYTMIWNEFYRDQDLQSEIVFPLTGGPDATSYQLQNVCWEKDYFTSSRPWTQKGPDVTVPFATSAPVVGAGAPTFNVPSGTSPLVTTTAGGGINPVWNAAQGAIANATWATTNLSADLTGATSVSINDLREAFAIQRYEEARARYGSRYTEYLRYLGVRSSDARLQRPEYLGGGKQTLQFSEVLQTAPDAADPDIGVGNLKGHGIGALRSNRYRRFFEEHGFVLTLISCKPKTMYAQQLPRIFNRRTKEDYFQRELQHIGQQEVVNKEVYAAHSDPDGIFGFQDRYDEYRRAESSIAGDFRDDLTFWHYARIFGSEPALNADFVKADPTKRVNAVTDRDVLWIMANHSVQARRMVAATGSSHIF